jgi:hypothetical protein
MQLKEEKVAQNVEMNSFRTEYSRLQGHIRAQNYLLESTKQHLVKAYGEAWCFITFLILIL